MKMFIVLACLATTVSMTAGPAMADSIRGKLGVTGRVGFINPADNNSDFYRNKTDTGLVSGGGLIYGIDDIVAVDLEATRATFGSETGDFGITDIALGAQYRLMLSHRRLVPYLGIGLDILYSDFHDSTYDIEAKVGGHIKGGFDYFLQRNLALTAEAKVVFASDAKITDNWTGAHSGDFDPSNFSTTVGLRFFFN